MRLRTIRLAAGLALGLGSLTLAPGCVVRGEGAVVYETDEDPPPPRVVVVPTARPGYVWVGGHWGRHGRRWVWHDGYWQPGRGNAVWRDGFWDRRGNRRVWVEGHWEGGGGGVEVRDHTH